ncbi:MAG TPA: amidohydrolase family protein [Alphaproteobacteria bacterium]|nr:amidohydrolase family protein [Alphaproteobacteria bacterium]
MTPKLRITGAKIAPLGGSDDLLDDMDLWIGGGRIAAIAPKGEAAPFAEGTFETLAFSNALVLPGLINSHSHSASALQRGKIGGAPLDLFVMEAMSRRSHRPLEIVRVGALLHAIEMLKHGVTGVVDHFRHGAMPSTEAVLTVFQAYQDIGIRAAVAPMFEDRRYIDSLPIEAARLPRDIQDRWVRMTPKSPDDYFVMMEEVVAETRGGERVRLMLGVDGPQRCTQALLEKTGEFAARHRMGLHTHLLEAKTQALMAPGIGGSFVAYLDRFGLISEKSSLAHFVWCTDRDIELAAEKRVNVVNNPVSNLVLGSGLQPTTRLLEAGVRVAVGSDGCSSNAINMFEQAKFSMLLSRISQPDCDRWMTSRQALGLATAGGAAVLGEPGKLGAIEVGAHADLAILRLDSDIHRPLGNVWNHLVMYETGQSIDTVLVAGEVVVKAGRCTQVDEDEIYASAQEFATQDEQNNAQHLSATRGERSVFQPLITEALGRPMDVNRFARLT